MGFPSTCKTHDLARLLGISDRRVQQLVEEKVLVQKSRDTFAVVSSVKAYVLFRENAAAAESGRFHGLSKERAAMVRIQRELAQIELDEKLGNTVLITDASAIIARYVLVMKNKLLGLGSKLAPLANPAAPLVAQEVIYNGVIECLEELSTLDTYGERPRPRNGGGESDGAEASIVD